MVGMEQRDIDRTVFGPYYGTPPEQNPENPRLEPAQPTRTTLRQRFLTRRRHRPNIRP